jgi:hypothetical protein
VLMCINGLAQKKIPEKMLQKTDTSLMGPARLGI